MVLKSVKRPPHPDHVPLPGQNEKRQTRWWIPYGAVAFRFGTDEEWKPLADLPPDLKLGEPVGGHDEGGASEDEVRMAAEAAWKKRRKAKEGLLFESPDQMEEGR